MDDVQNVLSTQDPSGLGCYPLRALIVAPTTDKSVQVNGEHCFVDLQLKDLPMQYHMTVPSKALSPDGLLVLGILKVQLASDELTTPAVYEAPIASANTAIKVKLLWRF